MNLQFTSRTMRFAAIIVWAALIATACTVFPGSQPAQHTPTSAAPAASSPTATGEADLVRGSQPGLGDPAASFVLKTGLADGKMVFIGVGGDLEGKVNPDLQV